MKTGVSTGPRTEWRRPRRAAPSVARSSYRITPAVSPGAGGAVKPGGRPSGPPRPPSPSRRGRPVPRRGGAGRPSAPCSPTSWFQQTTAWARGAKNPVPSRTCSTSPTAGTFTGQRAAQPPSPTLAVVTESGVPAWTTREGPLDGEARRPLLEVERLAARRHGQEARRRDAPRVEPQVDARRAASAAPPGARRRPSRRPWRGWSGPGPRSAPPPRRRPAPRRASAGRWRPTRDASRPGTGSARG